MPILTALAVSIHKAWEIKYLVLEVPEPPPQICQLRRGDQIVVKVLNHYARKLNIFVLGEAVGHGTIDSLRTQGKA